LRSTPSCLGQNLRLRESDTILFTIPTKAGMGSTTSTAISADGKELLRLCRTGRLYDIEKMDLPTGTLVTITPPRTLFLKHRLIHVRKSNERDPIFGVRVSDYSEV